MKFTNELPTKAGAYWGREVGVTDSKFLCEIWTHENGLETLTLEGIDRPLSVYAGFEFNGPLLAPEEVEDFAEVGRRWRADSSLKNWFPLTAIQIEDLKAELATLKANSIPREVFAREVEAAWKEGNKSGYDAGLGAVWTPSFADSRAHRVANGKEGV